MWTGSSKKSPVSGLHFTGVIARCAARQPIFKIDDTEWGMVCIRCMASPPVMSLIGVLKQTISKPLDESRVYEMSSSGPLYRFLNKHSKAFYSSEYYDDLPAGKFRYGTQCQDVEQLTIKNSAFDLVTSTEVFEHVPDDRKGFSEIHRVLKNKGWFVMMVPFYEHPTVERAILNNGELTHLVPPEYHLDPIRPEGCLCFRNYGPDIVDRLKQSGFAHASIIKGDDYSGSGHFRYIIVAQKSG